MSRFMPLRLFSPLQPLLAATKVEKLPYLLWTSSKTLAPVKNAADYASLKLLYNECSLTRNAQALAKLSPPLREELFLTKERTLLQRLQEIETPELRRTLEREYATLQILRGNYKKAQVQLSSLLISEMLEKEMSLHEIRRENGLIHLSLGILKQSQGEIQEALPHFKLACQKMTIFFKHYSPTALEQPYQQLFCALMAANHFNPAENVLTQMITETQRVFPEDFDKHAWLSSNLALIAIHQGDRQKALVRLKTLQNIYPPSEIYHTVIAYNTELALGHSYENEKYPSHLDQTCKVLSSQLGEKHSISQLLTSEQMEFCNDLPSPKYSC